MLHGVGITVYQVVYIFSLIQLLATVRDQHILKTFVRSLLSDNHWSSGRDTEGNKTVNKIESPQSGEETDKIQGPLFPTPMIAGLGLSESRSKGLWG